MNHNFDIENAKKYGILEAILISHFEFWIAKNKANETNFFDGKYWVYNTPKAFAELFPYVSEHQIRRALDHLRDEGVLLTGNYNKSAYDKTLWYTLTDSAISNEQDCQIDVANLPDGCDGIATPIPDINTYINNIPPISPQGETSQDDNVSQSQDSAEEKMRYNFNILWQEYPKKEGKTKAYISYKSWLKGKKTELGKRKLTNEEMLEAIENYKKQIAERHTEYKYIKQGSTFFNLGILDYLPEEEGAGFD